MNKAEARKIIAAIDDRSIEVKPSGALHGWGGLTHWEPGDARAKIEQGEYSADELDAFAWWMRNVQKSAAPQE